MAGLAQQPRSPNPQDGQPSAASMVRVDENDMIEPDEGEQEQYEGFIAMAQAIIYPDDSGQPNPEILANLRGDFSPEALALFEAVDPPITDSPTDSLATATVLLTLMIENIGKQQNKDFTDDVVQHAAREVMELLVELAEAAGIHNFSDRDIEGAWYRGVDIYRVTSPRADPIALTEEFKGLMAADRQGLGIEGFINGGGKVLPGLPGGAPLPQQGAR